MIRLPVVALLLLLSSPAALAAPRQSAIASLHAEARRIVDEWREAQNRADEPAYVALYEQKKFRGVKRARKGTTRYDWAGWSTDRLRMMKTRPTVATEQLRVTTWLEKKTLKRGIVEVRFVQRWKNPRYADHGIKVLLLVRNPSGGLRILYEDLLDSHPGWARQKLVRKVGGAGGFATVAEAWDKLGQRAPTLDQVEDALGSLATDDASERLLARAILENADPACKEIDEISECGDERYEWKELDPKLPWRNACVQRKAVQWALDASALTKRDVAELMPSLTTLVSLPRPEEELISSALALVAARHPAGRFDLLQALVNADRVEQANGHTVGLSPGDLERATAELHLDAAAAALSEKTQRRALLAALADERLKPETRLLLFDRAIAQSGPALVDALVALSEQGELCELSMKASLQLAALGKKQYLPTADGDAARLGRELCRNLHDTDAARQLRFWKSLVPPTGAITITSHLDDDFAERDEDGKKAEAPDEVSKLTRKRAGVDDLDAVWGAGRAPVCSADSCKVETDDGYLELGFATGKDGKRYVASIFRYHWRGCPC